MTVTTPIRPKRSETPNRVPNSLDLQSGELAFNVSDQKIYTKSSSGNIVVIGKANVNKAEIDNLNIDASTVTGFTIDKSVPADANFNDTTYETFTQSDTGLVPSPSADDVSNDGVFLDSQGNWKYADVNTLANVEITDPIEGQKLIYDGLKWKNAADPISDTGSNFFISNIISSTSILPLGSQAITIGNTIIGTGISFTISLDSSWVIL
jgi:hypothetical protein